MRKLARMYSTHIRQIDLDVNSKLMQLMLL